MEQINTNQIPDTSCCHKSSKLPLIIGIVLLISIVGGTAYYLGKQSVINNQASVNNLQNQKTSQSQFKPTQSIVTPEGNGTEGWKAYVNEKYGFEFKYPSEGKINVVENINVNKLEGYIISFSSPASQSDLSIDLNYNSKFNKEGTLFHTGYLDWYVKSYNPPQNCNVAKEISGTCNYALFYSTLNKTNLFSFTFRDNKVINKNITNRIVSSFKFTDQTQADETKGWKTYTNEKYGFEFKYPQKWNFKSDKIFPDTISLSQYDISILENAEGPITPITLSIIKNTSIQKEIDKYIKAYNYTNYKNQQIKVGELSATKISGIVQAESYITGKFNAEVFIQKGNVIIKFSFVDVEDVNETTFNQILSTFKFTQ